jgi:hypothetical protein
MPALVLVHGNAYAADCWDLTVDEIQRLAPELTVLAVDLPGRRSKPGDLRTLTIADFVDSVVADIEDAGLAEVVIGHPMAGLTVPGVVTKVGASRISEMILAAACVPHEGAAMVDVVLWPAALMARRNAKSAAPNKGPSPVTEVRVLQWSPARTTPIHGRPAPSGCIAYSGGDGVAS